MKFVISKFKLDRQFTKEEREFFVDCVKKTGEIEFRMVEGSDEFIQLEALLANFLEK